MRRALPLLALLALAACVDYGAQRRAFLASLVGRSEEDVVRALGVPTRSFETGGHRFLAYDERRLDIIPGFYGGGGWWGPYGWGFGGFPPEVVERGCETTFEIAGNRVLGWTLRGNACG